MQTRTGLWIGGLSLLAVLTALGAYAADDEFPQSARLTRKQLDACPPFQYALSRNVKAAEGQVASASVKVEGESLVFVDVDGNGSFGDVGTDGWKPDDDSYRYLVPVEAAIVVGDVRCHLSFDADGKTLSYRVEEPELPPIEGFDNRAHKVMLARWRSGGRETLVAWNALRLRNGLPPVHLDPTLSKGAYLHALYINRWRVTHEQDPERDGYTPEGAESGLRSSVGSLSGPAEIDACYRSFFHRIVLFEPDTRGVGIGTAKGACVLDGVGSREARPWQWPVIVPAPDTEDFPLRFSRERPVAHELAFRRTGIENAACPITLTFERDAVSDVTAELREDGPEGDEVPFEISWPGNPAHDSRTHNIRSILILAHRAFSPRSTYWVRVAYKYRGKAEERIWLFRTGRGE